MRTAKVKNSVVYFYENDELIAFIDYEDYAKTTGYAEDAAQNWMSGVFDKRTLLYYANNKGR